MFESSTSAEQAFYDAFERNDLTLMRRVWAAGDSACCVHPMWPRIVGHGAILESWARIFAHDSGIRIQFEVQQRIVTDDFAIHSVNEHLRLGDEPNPRHPVLATNVYRRTESGWLLTLHHASPGPASKPAEAADTVH